MMRQPELVSGIINFLTYSIMEYEKLKDKVKSLGLKVTKRVDGRRVKLTMNELRAKLPKKVNAFEKQAKHAKKFIRVCRTVLAETQPKAPKAPKAPVPKAPPAPPVPKARSPQKKNARAALMANLKANLIKRGLAKN